MNLGLVITEKHTKLRGFACPQAKREERREERERGRGNSNGVVGRGSQTCIYKVGRGVFEKKKRFEKRFEKIWKEIERKVSFLNKIWE